MTEPQIIRTPSGDDMVVLPLAEYEKLLARAGSEAEDAEDVAIYDACMAEIAADAPALPAAVSAAVLRGDSRLRAIRNGRDLTQQALAQKTDIGQDYLSDLESRRRAGSPETITKLAQALDVPMELLA